MADQPQQEPESLMESMYAQPELPLGLPPLPPQPRTATTVAVGRNTMLKVGDTTVLVPNPKYVETLEERLTAQQRDITNLTAGLRRLLEDQKQTRREIEVMNRRLAQKIDRFD